MTPTFNRLCLRVFELKTGCKEEMPGSFSGSFAIDRSACALRGNKRISINQSRCQILSMQSSAVKKQNT